MTNVQVLRNVQVVLGVLLVPAKPVVVGARSVDAYHMLPIHRFQNAISWYHPHLPSGNFEIARGVMNSCSARSLTSVVQ